MVQLKNLIMLSLSRRIGVNDSTVQSELEVTYEFSSSGRDCITSLRRWLIVFVACFSLERCAFLFCLLEKLYCTVVVCIQLVLNYRKSYFIFVKLGA